MKRILFFFLLTALPFLAAAQGTKQDTVTVLSDAEINTGTLADSVRIYYIQNGWKKSRLDSLAAYMQTKIGGGGGSGTVTSITAGAGLTGGTITTTGTIAADTTNVLVSKTFLNNNSVSSFSAGTTGLTPSTATKGAVTLAGTLNVANGGTGATTQQAAINALAGATTSGQYLRGNGTNVTMSAIQAGDVPTLNQNTTGSAASLTTARDIQTNLASTSAASFNGTANIQPGVTGTLPIGNGGTGQTTYTDGQLLIGNTATGGLSKATLTAGSNVTITNGNGTITIAATGGGGGGGSGVISGVVAGEVGYGIGADTLTGRGILTFNPSNNQLRIAFDSTNTNPTANIMVKGSGTGTNALINLENSAGTDKFVVQENGLINIGRNNDGTTQATGTIAVTGSETNIGLAFVTKGTGSITAQIPNAAISGGNSRGTNCVDFQTARESPNQVAGGTNCVIAGGNSNITSGSASGVLAGSKNSAGGFYSGVLAGLDCSAAGNYNGIVCGQLNTISSGVESSSIVGGSNNLISGSTRNAIVASSFSSITSTGGSNVVIGGASNIISGTSSFSNSLGSQNTISNTDRAITMGSSAIAYRNNQISMGGGQFAARGDAQASNIRLMKAVSGTIEDTLTIGGVNYNAGATGRAILDVSVGSTNARIWNAKIQVVAVVQTVGSGGTLTLGNSLIGNYAVGIKRIVNTTSLVGTVQNLHPVQADTGMETSVVTIDADDANEALRIRFTPPTAAVGGTVIRVVATVYLTEVGY